MENLNEKQREAVNHKDGPILIIAGAGSGKTRTLTSRVIKLIESGVKPENILAITFTNKAAKEMANRAAQIANRNDKRLAISNLPFMGTFHSFGASILKKECKLVERTPAFTIFDEDDSLSLIKKILKSLDISKDYFNPAAVRGKISRVKSELLDPEEYLDQKTALIFRGYENALVKNNAFDFDDLIEKVVVIFKTHPNILANYQSQFKYILIDEYQDVNAAQYQLVRLLARKHQNLGVVGDDAQCVLPKTKIATAKGLKMIKNLSPKDKIISAAGNGKTCATTILKIKKFKYKGPIIKITAANNKIVRLTPNHIIFTKPQLLDDIYYVYLMYRKDKGFRIGIVKGTRQTRQSGKRERQIGLIVRGNQEKADKLWILRVCPNRPEAEYYEYYYSFLYGIPTTVFDTNNRNMKLTQNRVNMLFKKINTQKRAQKLMMKELIYFSYPHWIPQGTTRHSSKRLRIRLTLFDDRRKSLLHPWGMSKISVNTKDLQLKEEIEKLGFKTRKGKLSDWRLEIARLSYGNIEQIANRLKKINSEIELVRSACLTKDKRLFFQPAAHARPTMKIAVKDEGEIKEGTIKKIEIEQYDGFVYDLDVENIHNYIANNFVVHNSIYGFRGSDFRNFLNFDNDWPNAKIVKLEQNYRSTANIIAAASTLIRNNKFQKPKELWTENETGKLVKLIASNDSEGEAAWIAQTIKTIALDYGNNKASLGYSGEHGPSTAILYRTNAQSRAIEQELIFNRVPYKIFGGLQFYQRKEIKDIVAGLRLASNPYDSVSAERLEKTFPKAIARHLLEELPRLGKELSILQLINFFLENSDYFSHLDQKFKNSNERIENINELITFAAEFKTLEEFLERVSLLQSSDSPAKTLNANPHSLNPVHLMTVHLSKGLEFDNVFVIGCNEGLLPHQMSFGSSEELEEERRLMYVAMTRAKKELLLSFFGVPSRFLYEIPSELTEFINLKNNQNELPNEEEMYIE